MPDIALLLLVIGGLVVLIFVSAQVGDLDKDDADILKMWCGRFWVLWVVMLAWLVFHAFNGPVMEVYTTVPINEVIEPEHGRWQYVVWTDASGVRNMMSLSSCFDMTTYEAVVKVERSWSYGIYSLKPITDVVVKRRVVLREAEQEKQGGP
jgi:hypothetical protein